MDRKIKKNYPSAFLKKLRNPNINKTRYIKKIKAKNAYFKKRISLLRRPHWSTKKIVRRKKTFLFFLPNVISRKRYIRRKTPKKTFRRIRQKLNQYWAQKKTEHKLPTVTKKDKNLSKKHPLFRNKSSMIKKTVIKKSRFPGLKSYRSLRRQFRRSSHRGSSRPHRKYLRIISKWTRWKHPLRSLQLRLPHTFKKQRAQHFSNYKNLKTRDQSRFACPSSTPAPRQIFSFFSHKITSNWNWKPIKSAQTKSLWYKKIFVLKTFSLIKPEKKKLYLQKVTPISTSQVSNPQNHTSRRKKVVASKKGIRGFATWSRILPPKNLHTKREAQKKFPPTRPRHAKSRPRLKHIKNQGKKRGLIIKKRKFAWKKKSAFRQKRWGWARTFKKKPHFFKRWKWRFPRWKRFPRIRGSFQATYWQHTDVFPYRIYRRPHQPYRLRKPWQQKKQKGLRLIRQKAKWGRLLRRSELVTLQKRYLQVYLNFFGPLTVRHLKERALRFRHSATFRSSNLSLTLTWFDQQLDITLYRLRLAPTLKIARLLVHQGYVRINGVQIRTWWKRVHVWDLVQITLESDYFFGKYWYSRNKYQRHLYRQAKNRFKHAHPQKLIIPSGFFTRYPRISDLTRHDRLLWREFGRLLLL